jgi:2,4-dienoyl-CoA reductase-like NADH-dependent reductase (Old Yellow Enzyme family)
MRFIIEIVTECQKRVKPSFIFGIKTNSLEFQENSFSPEEARALCQVLESARFDYVELSGSTYESFTFELKRELTKKREAFFLEFADEIVNH